MSDVSKSTLVGIVIDPESGELTGELHEGDKIVKEKSREELKGVVAAKGFGPFCIGVFGHFVEADLDKNDYKIIFCMMNGIKYNSYMVIKGAPDDEGLYKRQDGALHKFRRQFELRIVCENKGGV